MCFTYLSLPNPLVTSDLFSPSIAPPCQECHIIGITQYTVFSEWLISVRTHVFCGLIVHFFVLLNIPFCQHTTIGLFIHLLIGILVVLVIINQLLVTFVCRSLCGQKFHISWLSTYKHDFWIRLLLSIYIYCDYCQISSILDLRFCLFFLVFF